MRELTTMLVALALPAAAAAQTDRWVVRDTDGTLVGSVLSTTGKPAFTNARGEDSPLWVARRIAGKWLRLPVSRNAVWATGNSQPFLFEEFDCSGQPLLE